MLWLYHHIVQKLLDTSTAAVRGIDWHKFHFIKINKSQYLLTFVNI